MSVEKKISSFNRDAERYGGYLYTTNIPLSARLATQRTTDIILQAVSFKGCSVLDVGCGDGFYTIRFFDAGSPRMIVGIDAAEKAIQIAEKNKQGRAIQFVKGDALQLPFPDNSFDYVLIQSILHHSDDPLKIIREGFRVAPQILIHEPNGNNFGLKIIEKLSPYHREHLEKSYSSYRIKNWIKTGGGEVIFEKFAGFVPMFCPNLIARSMKSLEPSIERIPLIKSLACAVYVVVGRRNI